MRIVTQRKLQDFINMYIDSKSSIETRVSIISNNNFDNSNQIISMFKNSDTIWDGRIIFNICNNKYRIVAKIEYRISIVYIRYIWKHEEYDKINPKSI